MDKNLLEVKTKVYDKIKLKISNFREELESKEYHACRFKLDDREIICRNAKITPKKVGQFVTFWKRQGNGPIEPFNDMDQIDFYVVNVRSENEFGQFVFPKSVLINKGIISTAKKEGKRAFRVYPKWDLPNNKQAERTQKWQLNYFYKISNLTNFNQVSNFYKTV
ncbi:MepB family protein [Xanthomarina sp. F2636L]|uniref:MepB family protein n=1 Tax=Xanthomarina sp. F2636L TaxID=2996018 RepID=UPI00225E3DFF|nr:MepB family protein [Xanthomarina sp. F2636L]MCX7551907.1 MepB family protein [Xanthomarina sp. F2636L]